MQASSYDPMLPPDAERAELYNTATRQVRAILDHEPDWIAAMATVANLLNETFPYFHWTGFYRAISLDTLVVGPYQGGHGCIRITFDRGVCGAAARTRTTQLVPDVHEFPDHIACSGSTRSEIVVPIVTPDDRLLGVLDVDSDYPAAFSYIDQERLELLCDYLGRKYRETVVV